MTEYKEKLRIVYMGTPEFAAVPLDALIREGYQIPLVVTQPDRPKGRGKKTLPTPVKILAEKAGIPVLQPARIKDNEEFYQQLTAAEPDIIIVAAYGKILPPSILEIPRLGCVNIHASLLPRFRGAAPVQRCVMAGDEKTGITLMYMAEGMDTGDMIARAETLTERKTAGELMEELALLGADLLIRCLPELAAGTAAAEAQDDSLATYAPMIEKSEGKLDFSLDARVLDCLIRGMSPAPGAYTEYNGQRMKVKKAEVLESGAHERPGEVLSADENGIAVACGRDTIRITELQMPGKKPLKAADYLRGNPVRPGEMIGG